MMFLVSKANGISLPSIEKSLLENSQVIHYIFSIMLDLFTEFEAVLDILEQHEIEYAVCGGLAVTFYAQPRFTQDIDILIAADDCERCKEILLPLGFKFFSSPMPIAKGAIEIHKLTKIEVESGEYIFLDLIVPISRKIQQVLADRVRQIWQNKKIWVVSREGLITMKESTKRPQDQLDLDALKKGKK
jgi:hypothetical protein